MYHYILCCYYFRDYFDIYPEELSTVISNFILKLPNDKIHAVKPYQESTISGFDDKLGRYFVTKIPWTVSLTILCIAISMLNILSR